MCAIAARSGSAEPEFVDDPVPSAPGEGEVLCRTLQLGVCGTDREILESTAPWVPKDLDHLILGHECLARVEDIGDGVRDAKVGDLVVPVVRRPLPGAVHRVDLLSFGQYTERGIAFEHGFSARRWIDRPEFLFGVPEAIAEIAVLTEPISIAEKGVNEALIAQRARLAADAWSDPPPRVLVTGMGPIGFAGVIACRCRGWPVDLYGRDPGDSFRAGLAERMGARYVSARSYNFSPDDVERDGYDLILECTGSDEVMVRSAEALASRGVMVWIGSVRVPRPKTHNVDRLMRLGLLRNHIHIGSVNAAPRDFRDALAHLAQMYETHRSEVEAVITARVAPEESLWHYRQRVPQGIKTVVMYE